MCVFPAPVYGVPQNNESRIKDREISNLSIGKKCSVESLEHVVDDRRADRLEDRHLTRRGLEDVVEIELMFGP